MKNQIRKKSNNKQYLRALVEGAMMLAVAWVIDYVCALAPYNAILFPAGGSITVGMIPIIYYAYRHGAAWGVGAGFVFSGLQIILGWYPPPAGVWWAFVLCILLDYVVAFTVLGLGGIFRNQIQKHGMALMTGSLVALGARYVAHIASGYILFAGYAEWFFTQEGFPAWGAALVESLGPDVLGFVYSVVYNGMYMIPEMILTAVVALLLARIPKIVTKVS